MKSFLTLFSLTALLLVGGCAMQKEAEVKSPCAGADGSPCDRRPVNHGWLS